jgi:hypothetical protein
VAVRVATTAIHSSSSPGAAFIGGGPDLRLADITMAPAAMAVNAMNATTGWIRPLAVAGQPFGSSEARRSGPGEQAGGRIPAPGRGRGEVQRRRARRLSGSHLSTITPRPGAGIGPDPGAATLAGDAADFPVRGG